MIPRLRRNPPRSAGHSDPSELGMLTPSDMASPDVPLLVVPFPAVPPPVVPPPNALPPAPAAPDVPTPGEARYTGEDLQTMISRQ